MHEFFYSSFGAYPGATIKWLDRFWIGLRMCQNIHQLKSARERSAKSRIREDQLVLPAVFSDQQKEEIFKILVP
jgi:hypothetical protein